MTSTVVGLVVIIGIVVTISATIRCKRDVTLVVPTLILQLDNSPGSKPQRNALRHGQIVVTKGG